MSMNLYIHHQMYVIPGIVDGAVCKTQSETRRDKRGEVSIVHEHAHSVHDQKLDCNPRCLIFIPEHETISYLDYKQGAVPPRKEDK